MILSADELRSLVGAQHRSPHQLLGMHPLGGGDAPAKNGAGLVVRTIQPAAQKVEVIPTHEKDKPRFALKRIPNSDVFEGTTNAAKSVYAYDLAITYDDGHTRQTRDPYSFLPTLGENFGHAIAEALAAGLPPVISDRTPWRDLDRHGAGTVLSLEEPGKFADELDRFARLTAAEMREVRTACIAYAKAALADARVLADNRRLFGLD